jgi:hypothetical protein
VGQKVRGEDIIAGFDFSLEANILSSRSVRNVIVLEHKRVSSK